MLNLDADTMFYAVLNCDSFLVNFIKPLGLFKLCNFVTKLPNPGSPKLPTINCFLMREMWLNKLFHCQLVFTKIWYNQKQPNKARPKILRCCDEIMISDKITGLVGIFTKFKGVIFEFLEEKIFHLTCRRNLFLRILSMCGMIVASLILVQWKKKSENSTVVRHDKP